MRVSVRLEGAKELQAAFSRMSKQVTQATATAVRETAQELEGAVKLKIQQGPKTGRTYRRGGVVHQASAPGEAPASDTGTLLGSIYHERESDLAYVVGTRIRYAPWLEYGSSRMAARPFFRPSLEQIQPVYQGRLERIINGALS